ncbi:MAG: transglutaminase-like cysteine peptidase [Pseudomonadales bacterium]|nr:transglutaminase-like cysteine peptidase [Pseudomonadales bacterium]
MRLGLFSKLAILIMGLVFFLPVFAVAESGLGFTEFYLAKLRKQYGDDAEQRVRDWSSLVDRLQGKQQDEQIEQVNRFFNSVRFLDDQLHWRRGDYWATPVELLATNGGDCEDFAIAKYFTLKHLGLPVDKMRLTYVKALELNQAHMVLTYYKERGEPPLVLDNLTNNILPANERRDLVPVYSFNGDGLWKAKQQGDTRLGNADDIVMWRELRDRMPLQLRP